MRSLAFVLPIIFLAGSCASRPPAGPGPTLANLAVSSRNTFVFLGDQEQMTALEYLTDGAVQLGAGAWSSDAPDVALVNASGLVTGVGSGQATIAFDMGGRRASKIIRVVPNFAYDWNGTYVQTECHGTGDQVVSWRESQRMHDALVAAGRASELLLLDGAPHAFQVEWRGEANRRANETMDAFLGRLLAREAAA